MAVGAAILGAVLFAACDDATGTDPKPAQLTYVRAPSYDTLFVADPGTGAVTRRIVLPMPSSVTRVSPGGDRLALVSKSQLWVMNLDGTNARAIATNPLNVRWSPDGKRLVYIRGGQPEQLHLINVDGTGDITLPGAVPGAFQGLDWSPAGDRIAFEGVRNTVQFVTRTIYVINTDGTGLQDVEQNLPGPEIRSSGEPTWSPDGKRLAFHRSVRTGNSTETNLWVATLATGEVRRITTGSVSDVRADWSPNGDLIAFLRFEDSDVPDVFVVRPDGTGLTRITSTPLIREEEPGWLRE